MGKMNKGIKGRLELPDSKECLNNIYENKEVFMAVIERDFKFAEYDIYEASYDDRDAILIEFNIMNDTLKECRSDLSRFKKEIHNHFGFKPGCFILMTYEKV